jgi:cell division protein FtsI/penicillin-binding protein 2
MVVALFLGISGSALVARLAYLQLVKHGEYQSEAQSFHSASRVLPAPRGSILDRNGNPLATSVETFNVFADAKLWADDELARRAAAGLAPLLNRDAAGLIATATERPSGPALLALNVPYNQGREVIGKGLPGVIVEPSSKRVNPEGNLAAPLLGFIGRESQGLTGLELDLNGPLTGTAGRIRYERDSLGNQIPFGYHQEAPATPGKDVVLTIDRTIQRMAERELDEAIKQTKATGGTVIVQEPATGAILAMVSRPSFDLTKLDLNDAGQMALYRNRAVTDQYEPGSVFKLVTMAAALDTGKVTPNTTYNDTGAVVVGERTFANWDFSRNGTTDMTKVLIRSLNTGTVWLADRVLGSALFYQYVRAFGFGEPSGIGLSGEAPGQYRLPTQADWYEADLASNSFGQGISTTPLQIVNMASAIANGGTLMRPYVVREVRGDGSAETTQSHAIRRVISERSAATLRGMMREVLDANPLATVPGYTAGGKSGTAYVPQSATDTRGDAYKDEVTIPSYLGFAPLNNPRITILVKLDNLASSDFGGTLTAPVFSRLAQGILTYLRVPPDQPETLNSRPPTPAPTPTPTHPPVTGAIPAATTAR